MSTTTQEIPKEVLRLLEVPAPDDQCEAQLRGAACVWDGTPLTAETAVELGERRHRHLHGHFSTFPRGCVSCVADRAHRAVLDHCRMCEQCVEDGAICMVGRVLYRLVREGWRA
ncbi:hypothetical protein [Streptomyces sp. NPDC049915]|uniref:hypothetical protein n=1 Tax=Streptomyces sp. NPDC049915 TaxID=3155510 RepID=UPI00342046A5